MLDEKTLRRPDFVPGPMVRLADGRNWVLPGPPERSRRETEDRDHPLGPDYLAMLAAITESEDEVDRLRNELALAICLLTRNYDLGPGAVRDLLDFAPDHPDLSALQAAFHEIAMSHLGRLQGQGDLATGASLHPRVGGLHRPAQPDTRAESGKV